MERQERRRILKNFDRGLLSNLISERCFVYEPKCGYSITLSRLLAAIAFAEEAAITLQFVACKSTNIEQLQVKKLCSLLTSWSCRSGRPASSLLIDGQISCPTTRRRFHRRHPCRRAPRRTASSLLSHLLTTSSRL